MKRTLKNVLDVLFLITFIVYSLYPSKLYANTNSWNSATNLPHSLASHTSYVYNDSLFVTGGATTNVNSLNISSSINSVNGSLLSWNTTSPLLSTFWHSTAMKNENVYILGGATFPPTESLNNAYLGKINANAINTWISITPLPKKLSLGATTILNNKIYYAGGLTEVSGVKIINRSIYATQITANGTIGNWSEVGLLPYPMYGFGFIGGDNTLTIIGGDTSIGVSSQVFHADVEANGLIGSWQETTPLPEPIYRSGVIKVGSTIYSIGGITGGNNTINKVYYAKVNNDGSVDPWELSNNLLPVGICCGSVASNGTYIYLTGGHNTNTGAYFDTTYYTKVLSSSEISLPVPLLKQTSEPWQSNVYDTANKWNPSNPTINAFGCAMTSAAMVLQYYNINKLPDGTSLNPGTLNTWLNSQKDGYIGNGLINWQAISRLSKVAKTQNPEFQYDALEYKRSPHDADLLKTEIQNNRPAILGVPGHFIVGKGISGDTFKINDPFYNRQLLSDGYNNTFQSMHRYIPSFTNLSYILIPSSPDVHVSILDHTNLEVSESYIQNPIVNPTNTQESNGEPQKMTYIEQPNTGMFTILFTSDSDHINNSTMYLYDSDGEVVKYELTGAIHSETQDTYRLSFRSESNSSSELLKEVSTEVLIDEVKTLKRLGEIQASLEHAIITILENAQQDTNKNHNEQAQRKLDTLSNIIDRTPQKLISEEAKEILERDIKELEKSITTN